MEHGLNHTEGNHIYTMLVHSCQQWETVKNKNERFYGNNIGVSVGVTQISLSRQMGHTTAITQLFKENVKDSLFFSCALTKTTITSMLIPLWCDIEDQKRIISVPGVFNATVDITKFRDAKYLMVDFSGASNRVREALMDILYRQFPMAKHIFIVQ